MSSESDIVYLHGKIGCEMWQFKPAPNEWSVHEVIIHLADSESNAALRARKLIVEPGGTLMGYDQEQWAVTLDYHDQDLEDALDVVRLARKTTYNLLKKLSEEVFDHIVIHPEYNEPYTFEKLLVAHTFQQSDGFLVWDNLPLGIKHASVCLD